MKQSFHLGRSLQKGLLSLARRIPSGQKAAPFLWPVSYQGYTQWLTGDFRNYVREGFEVNSVIYSAIMCKTRAIAQAVLRGYEGEPDNPQLLDRNHPLSRLLMRPNAFQSQAEFCGTLETYLNIAGNAYIFLDRSSRSQLPKMMYTLRPDRVYLVPDETSGIKGYLYRPEGRTIEDGIPMLPEDLIHVKFPNPLDPFEGMGYGLSPLAPLSKSGDVDNMITRFLKLVFQRGGLPLGLLKFDVPLEDFQIDEIKQRWRDIYGGIDNWTDIGVLDQGASYDRIGQNFDELGFEVIDERNESRILGPFGVPPILIGTRFGLERSTYSNYREARQAFWEDTMSYELLLQETEFEFYLSSDDQTFVKYDLSGVPGLRKETTQLVDAAFKMWTMGVPGNDAFRVVGLAVDEYEAGAISFISGQVKPVDIALNPPPNPFGGTPTRSSSRETGGEEEETPAEDVESRAEESRQRRGVRRLEFSVERKALYYKRIDRIARSHESDFYTGARSAFEEDRRAVLAIIKSAEKKALERKASIDWIDVEPDVIKYMNESGVANWRSVFTPLIAGVVDDVGESWGTDLGLTFNLRHLLAEEWFSRYTLEFAQPIVDTTKNSIQSILLQGQEEGWSIGEMQRRLDQTFRQWMDGNLASEEFEWLRDRLPPHRTEMIARTETIRASNAGSFRQFKDWGVEKKEWSAQLDARVRKDHADANGQVRPIDEPFEIGGYGMMYPGDASLGAPPREFIQCRCGILPGGEVLGSTGAIPVTEVEREYLPISGRQEYFDLHDRWRDWWDVDGRSALPAMAGYTDGTFRSINRHLRDNKPAAEGILRDIDSLDNAFARGPGAHRDVLLYRGVPTAAVFDPALIDDLAYRQAQIGTIRRDAGFGSFSTNQSTAQGFIAGGSGDREGILILARVPKGTKGAYVDVAVPQTSGGDPRTLGVPGEREWVIARDTKWRVVDIKKSQKRNVLYEVTMEVSHD